MTAFVTLTAFPPMQFRALKGAFAAVSSNNIFSGNNTFSGANTFSGSNTFSASNVFSATNSFSAANTFLSTVKFGASGTAGAPELYPSTALKGKTTFTMADNATDTTTNITVAQQSGARTYTLPDAGASASLVMTEGTQTVNGVKTLTGANIHSGVNTFTSTVKIGQSGTAGLAELYPTTALKGKVTFTTSDNSTDTTTNLNVAAQTGARTYTMPDAGGSASLVMSEGAQTVNGVKTFGSVPLGTAYIVACDLTTITGLAGAAKIIVVAPFAGVITNGRAAIDGAITATDIVIQLRINTDNVTNGSMTIVNAGSGFGSKASCTPSAANAFVAGDVLNATLTGGVGTVGGSVSMYITRTS